MNKHICDNNDDIASLYIDDMLEEEEKRLFEAHLTECSQCRNKFDSLNNVVGFLRCSDELTLPEGFSENLHRRLSAEHYNKKPIFIFNKKVIASLSAAAVLLLGIWIYSAIPYFDIGSKSSARQMTGSLNAESEAASPSVPQEAPANIIADNQIEAKESIQPAKQEVKRFEEGSSSTTRNGSGTLTSDKNKSTKAIAGIVPPQSKENQTTVTFGASVDSNKQDEKLVNASAYTLDNQVNPIADIEYDLVCSKDFPEAEKLNQAMLDLGAMVISNSTGSSINQAEFKLPSNKYNDEFIASVEKQGQIKLTEITMNSKISSISTASSIDVNRFDIKKDYIIIKINYITK